MVERKVTVNLSNGLHARNAYLFVKQASKFRSDIFVEKAGKTVNAKSIMGIMSQILARGTEITISAKGTDADLAVDALAKMVN